MLHNCTLTYTFVAYTFANYQVVNQGKNLSWPTNGKASEISFIFHVLETWKVFTSSRTDPFLEIGSIAVAKICWNFRNRFAARGCTCELFFRNPINQLHVNRTWSVLAVISFTAVISLIANVRHQMYIRLCKNITNNSWTRLY